MTNLKLTFNRLYSTTTIQSISNYAFYDCDSIEEIDLSGNKIAIINENQFHFRNPNDKTLKIDLTYNRLNEDSFPVDSLVNFKRPAKLYVKNNEISNLKDEVWNPFKEAHEQNILIFLIKEMIQVMAFN